MCVPFHLHQTFLFNFTIISRALHNFWGNSKAL
jgi:hypothetical protein